MKPTYQKDQGEGQKDRRQRVWEGKKLEKMSAIGNPLNEKNKGAKKEADCGENSKVVGRSAVGIEFLGSELGQRELLGVGVGKRGGGKKKPQAQKIGNATWKRGTRGDTAAAPASPPKRTRGRGSPLSWGKGSLDKKNARREEGVQPERLMRAQLDCPHWLHPIVWPRGEGGGGERKGRQNAGGGKNVENLENTGSGQGRRGGEGRGRWTP